MDCQACGAPLGAGTRFCSRCGAAATPQQQAQAGADSRNPGYTGAPYAYAGGAMVRAPRVALHVRTLGILWVCFGVWRIVGGLAGLFFLSAFTTHRWGGWGFPYSHWGNGFPPHWMGFFAPLVAAATVASAGLAFVTGYALLNRKSWGRVLALVAAVLALFKFPLGTAIGVYTLWVLAPSPSGAEYDHLAATTGT